MSDLTASQRRRRERVNAEVQRAVAEEMATDPYPDTPLGRLPDREKHYVLTVLETLCRLRTTPPAPLPLEYYQARQWYEWGYELPVVIESIHKVHARRSREPNWDGSLPLRYCRPAVESAVVEVADLQNKPRPITW